MSSTLSVEELEKRFLKSSPKTLSFTVEIQNYPTTAKENFMTSFQKKNFSCSTSRVDKANMLKIGKIK